MVDLDEETLQRAKRWCADAGRQATQAEITDALSSLSWGELLNVRALLADPPPSRPLGPKALADLARGIPADLAAEREREGRYRAEDAEPAAADAPEKTAPKARAQRPSLERPKRGRARRPSAPVVRRRRDQTAPAPPPAHALLSLEELKKPGGRTILERLLREHGARRFFLLQGVSAFRRQDGEAPSDLDLDALLDQHGLTRAFAHRERDELVHALRAARGEPAGAAARLGLTPEAFRAALLRLGVSDLAEKLQEERRAELRSRATLAQRCRMLLEEPDRLLDLGLLPELEEDLKARIPEHLRALRAGGSAGDLKGTFARSLGLPKPAVLALCARLSIDLGDRAIAAPPSPSPGVSDRPRTRRPGAERAAARPGQRARGRTSIPSRDRPGPPRPRAPRTAQPGGKASAPRRASPRGPKASLQGRLPAVPRRPAPRRPRPSRPGR